MHRGASVEEVMPSQSSALNRKCSVFAEDSTLFRYFVFIGQFVCRGAIEWLRPCLCNHRYKLKLCKWPYNASFEQQEHVRHPVDSLLTAKRKHRKTSEAIMKANNAFS